MQPEDYTIETTEDLLQIISWKDQEEYKKGSEQAFLVLYHRFSDGVIRNCERICKGMGMNETDALIIVENVFKRFLRYGYKRFDPKEHSNVDKGLKNYLYTIAENEKNRYFAQKNGIGVSPYDGTEQVIYEMPKINEDTIPDKERRTQLAKEKEIIELAIDRHTWKHKVIYLTYKFHQIDGHKMPRALLKELREVTGLKQQNVIQAYKKEITDTINDYLKIYGKEEK